MPNIPCSTKVDCAGVDLPIRNFSSEAPDIPSEPIPFGGLVTPYVPQPLSPESGGGTGLPTCPTGFRYDPATGTCISNAIFPPTPPPGCTIELKILSARVGNDACGWVDMTAFLNSLRQSPTNCDGCYWTLNLTASMLAYSPCENPVLEVRYKQNGLTASLTYGGGDDYLMDFTPSSCFCLENMHFSSAQWGNDTQGYIDVKDILNTNIIGRHYCYCPGYPDRPKCCGDIAIMVDRETLGNFTNSGTFIAGRLIATAFYYGSNLTTTVNEGEIFTRAFELVDCPEPPPDPPPDPPKWGCVNGNCIEQVGGSYSSLQECLDAGCEDPPPPPPECPPGYYFEPLANACVPIANPCASGYTRYFGSFDPSRITPYHAIMVTGPNDPTANPGTPNVVGESVSEMCVNGLSERAPGLYYLWYLDTYPDPGSSIGTFSP